MPKFNSTACSLLGFLQNGPLSGWDLARIVEETLGNFWHVTRSQIYRELKTLEANGLVVGGERGARDKRAYEITEAGKATFQEWLEQEPGPVSARYPLLLSVWFGNYLSDERLEWFLRLHRAQHQKDLDRYQQIADALPRHDTPEARALRFGLYYEEAVLRWFDSLPTFGGNDELEREAVVSESARELRAGRKPSRDN